MYYLNNIFIYILYCKQMDHRYNVDHSKRDEKNNVIKDDKIVL